MIQHREYFISPKKTSPKPACQCQDEDKECTEGVSSACIETCLPLGQTVPDKCDLGEALDVCRCKDKTQVLFKGRCVNPSECGCISEEDGRSFEVRIRK